MTLKQCESPSKVSKCNLCLNAALFLWFGFGFLLRLEVLTGLMNVLLNQRQSCRSVCPLKGCSIVMPLSPYFSLSFNGPTPQWSRWFLHCRKHWSSSWPGFHIHPLITCVCVYVLWAWQRGLLKPVWARLPRPVCLMCGCFPVGLVSFKGWLILVT